ncbi:MAG: response regulator, partial [Proteobacteria bacterium]|nr:response regulator [Pseudomonadota bacterium]
KHAAELPDTDSFQNQLNMLKRRSANPHATEENVFAAIKNSIKFRRHNLIQDEFDSSIKFDYVFLRNVLIYFDEEAIAKVCTKISRTLNSSGFFIISVTETLPLISKEFVSIGNSIYRHSNGDKPSKDSGKLHQTSDLSKKIRPNEISNREPNETALLKVKNRVLVIEDSVPIQKVLKEVYSKLPNTEVVGIVPSVDAALKAAKALTPNIISLDMKLEDGSGIEFLKQINFPAYAKAHNTRCFLVTDCSQKEGDLVLEALTLGVNWYVQKPHISKMKEFAAEIEELIHGLFTVYDVGAIRDHLNPSPKNSFRRMSQIELVVIGSSTGGTEIVKQLISGFAVDFPPIVVVQHMPVEFTGLYSKRIADFSGKSVIEISESVPLERGKAYIARGGTHAEVFIQNNCLMARPNNNRPEVNCFKPSVSVLFDSVKNAGLARKSVAVMLTGMGFDGAEEMKALKDSGAYTIGQSKDTCTVYGMPRAAFEKGALCCSLSPSQIIDLLNGE